jgi:release factor glutamine methyltransferase
MTISTWLKLATKQLKDTGITSARLDAELLLAETLRKPRTYLHAHLNEDIDPRRVDIANARLDLRLERVPLAYILGYKEFFGRKFRVTPAVLVPRPETEDLMTIFLQLTEADIAPKTVIDIGTGSGILGITAALERPQFRTILSDVSTDALKIAEHNAAEHNVRVATVRQSLLTGHLEPLDYILANLPYVDPEWQTSPELRHEPARALYADDGGLALILKLIPQAARHLQPNGVLFLEADPEQHPRIIELAMQHGFQHETTLGYALALRFVRTER